MTVFWCKGLGLALWEIVIGVWLLSYTLKQVFQLMIYTKRFPNIHVPAPRDSSFIFVGFLFRLLNLAFGCSVVFRGIVSRIVGD